MCKNFSAFDKISKHYNFEAFPSPIPVLGSNLLLGENDCPLFPQNLTAKEKRFGSRLIAKIEAANFNKPKITCMKFLTWMINIQQGWQHP